MLKINHIHDSEIWVLSIPINHQHRGSTVQRLQWQYKIMAEFPTWTANMQKSYKAELVFKEHRI